MELKKTVLNETHHKLGAKMVPFAGYEMPLQYSSLVQEHHCVRNGVGLFDVSHMGEFVVKGPQAFDLVQKITTNDVSKLAVGQAQYSCLPNNDGGIIDDLLVYKMEEEAYMLVVNAANIEKDWNWIQSQNTESVSIENLSDSLSLFALQGPLAEKVLQKLTTNYLAQIPYYSFEIGTVANIPDVIISATGYTGAGGFELYVANENAAQLWETLLAEGKGENIQPIGLGARDTLRLEKGYCLYGNDINDTTSPLEAGLGWITKLNSEFINASFFQQQKADGLTKKLVGFEMIERGIARKDYAIFDENDTEIGTVTSGGQSPTLAKGIGMGYVSIDFASVKKEIYIGIRNKKVKAQIVKMPFVK